MIKPPIVNVDFSELEKRVAKHLDGMGCTHLDIHILSAAQMFGVMYSNVTKTQREAAKRRNFGIVYSPKASVADLIPGPEVMKQVFTEDELANHCRSYGVKTVKELVEFLRRPVPPVVTHRASSNNPEFQEIK